MLLRVRSVAAERLLKGFIAHGLFIKTDVSACAAGRRDRQPGAAVPAPVHGALPRA